MANRLKMVQKELLFILFSQNWSKRKINKALNIHRATIARYYNEWIKQQQNNPEKQGADTTNVNGQSVPEQTVPLNPTSPHLKIGEVLPSYFYVI